MKKVVMFAVVALCFVPSFANAFDRFEVGVRVPVAIEMVKGHSDTGGGFVGSINELDPSGLTVDPFIGVRLTPHLGVELGYNSRRFDANSVYPGSDTSDGAFTFGGPSLAVIGRILNESRWNIYVGLGAVYYFGGFDADGWWANGESGDDIPVPGKTREMYVDDAIALSAFIGTDVRVWKHLYADVRIGYEKFSSDVSFSGFMNGTRLYENGGYKPAFDSIQASVCVKVKF